MKDTHAVPDIFNFEIAFADKPAGIMDSNPLDFREMRKLNVAQMLGGHHRVVTVFLNVKNRHSITFSATWKSGRFWGKDRPYSDRTPRRGKPMGGGLSADCGMEIMVFFWTAFGMKKRHRL